jgi:C-terminal processing protease CtpA/Prc
MSGLVLREDQLGIEVIDVTSGTPAEGRALPGDRLISIDGRPAGSMRIDEVRALLREHGATRLLRLRRGKNEFEVQLKLSRRI